MIIVNNLNKSFGSTTVLQNTSLSIDQGEICVLLGKSGSGKTTLLRCICGLESFDSGKIIINRNIVNSYKDILNLKGEIGMVFQNFNLFPHMSVCENITLSPVNILKQNKFDAVENALSLLKKLKLEDKYNAYPFELSGGQKQRVAIARALALNPIVLCLDEPTSSLDSYNIDILKEILFILKENKTSILIVTHDKNFAKSVGDKIITMENGCIQI